MCYQVYFKLKSNFMKTKTMTILRTIRLLAWAKMTCHALNKYLAEDSVIT